MNLNNAEVMVKLRANQTQTTSSSTGTKKVSSSFRFNPDKAETWPIKDEVAVPTGRFVFSKKFVIETGLLGDKGLAVINDGEGGIGFGICSDSVADLFKTPKANTRSDAPAKKSIGYTLKGFLNTLVEVGLIKQFETPTYFNLVKIEGSEGEYSGIPVSAVYELVVKGQGTIAAITAVDFEQEDEDESPINENE